MTKQNMFISFLVLAFPISIISIKILGPLIYVILAIIGIQISISKRVSPLSIKETKLFSWITLIYFIIMVLSVMMSSEPTNSWIHLARKLQFLIAPFVILAIYNADIKIDNLLKSIKIGVVLIGLIVSTQYIMEPNNPRLSGMFNANTFGDLASVMTIFTISGIKSENKKSFLLSLFALSCGTIAVVLSASRGSIISFMVMLFIYAILVHKVIPDKQKDSWIAVFVALMTFFVAYTGAGVANKRFSIIHAQVSQWDNGDNETSSVGVRLEMYKSGLKAFVDSPIIGYGYRNSTAVASRYADKKAKDAIKKYSHLHDEYINHMVNAGIVGLLSLLALLFVPLSLSLKSISNHNAFPYALMGITLVSGYATLGITHGMFQWEYENSFYLFFLAYIMSKIISIKQNPSHQNH